ncbi:hypothetical protein H5410_040550 [Solanum commersonii]|uniref:Uncharacterized protein n=1 Tax=Solanum commersonii TaxID=4109 RepID=A0A9J5XRR7_SOLCO|nr:hypothetical protein H5410_040550 [Solanum commersonii]
MLYTILSSFSGKTKKGGLTHTERSGKENFVELAHPELFDQSSLASRDEMRVAGWLTMCFKSARVMHVDGHLLMF